MRDATVYGTVSEDFIAGLELSKADTAWNDPAHWPDWLKDTKAQLTNLLWPEFDTTKGFDRSRASSCDALTRADFKLLEKFQNVGSAAVASTSVGQSFLLNCFQLENAWGTYRVDRRSSKRQDIAIGALTLTRVGMLSSYLVANPTSYLGTALPQPERDIFERDIYNEGVTTRTDVCMTALKLAFQRPRAYQLALEFKPTGFFTWTSLSANSPSMPSGHAMESLFGYVHFKLWLESTTELFGFLEALRSKFPRNELPQFREWSAGVGDRRISAGLHFPSDSLASFFICLRLMPEVYGGSEIAKALQYAGEYIRSSKAFTLCKLDVDESSGSNPSPFSPMIEELIKLIGNQT